MSSQSFRPAGDRVSAALHHIHFLVPTFCSDAGARAGAPSNDAASVISLKGFRSLRLRGVQLRTWLADSRFVVLNVQLHWSGNLGCITTQ
jgi:hypothetical protein